MLETAHSLHCYHGHQAKIIAFISMSDSYFIFLFLHFHSKFAFSKQPFFLFFYTPSLTALSLYSSWKKSRTFLGGEDGVPKWSCQKARREWHNPFCICKWNESSLTTLFDFSLAYYSPFFFFFPPFFFSIFLTLPFFFHLTRM